MKRKSNHLLPRKAERLPMVINYEWRHAWVCNARPLGPTPRGGPAYPDRRF